MQGLADSNGGNKRSQIINDAKSLITLQERSVGRSAGEELLEFVRPYETLQITTLSQLKQKAKLGKCQGRLPVYNVAYHNALQDTGLRDVSLIGRFSRNYGCCWLHSRDEREADNTIIRAFPRLKRDDHAYTAVCRYYGDRSIDIPSGSSPSIPLVKTATG